MCLKCVTQAIVDLLKKPSSLLSMVCSLYYLAVVCGLFTPFIKPKSEMYFLRVVSQIFSNCSIIYAVNLVISERERERNGWMGGCTTSEPYLQIQQ